MSQFSETMKTEFDGMGIPYTDEQITLCETYFHLVVETNRHTNLTRITSEPEAAKMHFADAILLLSYFDLPAQCRVIDVGSGAGFPGIPIKILRPDIDITFLDASGKKTEFISRAADELNIESTVLCARAEEAARTELRENFDIVLSRAVAPLSMLLELCIPLLKTGGILAAWKGENFSKEIIAADNAMRILDCTLNSRHDAGRGAILLINKQKPTADKYPRRFSKIKSQPL